MTPAHDGARAAPGIYWEPRVSAFVTQVRPGGFRVTRRADLALVTLLGSCVAACICDPRAGVGGLNHFLLPDEGSAAAPAADAARYGAQAMEMLIAEIVRRGGERSRLQAKLFGGAEVMALPSASPVGKSNREFARGFLRREGIPVTAADLGGTRARRVFFKPAADRVLVQMLDHTGADRVRREEDRLRRRLFTAPASGGVTPL
ncbi:MAG: chemotaxis protein CheD [Paracoccaceae bacterium]